MLDWEKKISGRNRPLLIKLVQAGYVRNIMQAKSNLRNLDGFGNVYIERDLTATEREQNRRLRKELYEKRDGGKS